ncbi:uncharacterized protein LOC143783280 [Ranitomeya variabilis]|uniref:uncharacterized protein LOC143783280 n=1 Tax=Ranitomeya variabilis TaxID=490064 RepID=UPI0040572AB3
MESISSTIKLLFPRCVMAGIDLKDAYYHLPIHAEHQQYLRVAVILEGQELGWIINFEKSRLNPDTTQMFLGIQLDSIQGADVRVFSDNSTTVAYVNRQGGTRSGSLMTIAGEIFQFAETHLASLTALHIRGIENTKADYLSRNRLRQGEWSLNRTVFRLITRAWGVPQIDLFATRGNSQDDWVQLLYLADFSYNNHIVESSGASLCFMAVSRQILGQINPMSYKLQLPPNHQILNAFHTSLLKPVVLNRFPKARTATSTSVAGGPSDVFEVKDILDSKKVRGRPPIWLTGEVLAPRRGLGSHVTISTTLPVSKGSFDGLAKKGGGDTAMPLQRCSTHHVVSPHIYSSF